MAVSPHPSVKPGKPSKPPSAHQPEGKSGQEGVRYGASHKIHTHGMGDHKSEFEGAHEFPKAGDKE